MNPEGAVICVNGKHDKHLNVSVESILSLLFENMASVFDVLKTAIGHQRGEFL